MAKDLTKKMNEIMDVFMDLSQNNPVLSEIQEMTGKMREMVQSVADQKFNLTETIFETLDQSFEKYKDRVKTVNRQKDLLKGTMKKMKELYQDSLSKKIKEMETFTLTQESLNLAKQTFRHYEETLDTFNRQTEILVDALKEFKETLHSQDLKGTKKEPSVKKAPSAKSAE